MMSLVQLQYLHSALCYMTTYIAVQLLCPHCLLEYCLHYKKTRDDGTHSKVTIA